MAKHSLIPLGLGQRFEPFRELNRELESLEKSFFNVWRDVPLTSWAKEGSLLPNVDIIENDKEIQLIADLPGLEERDIHVEVNDGILTLRREKYQLLFI